MTAEETRTSISSSSDQEEACLQLAPGHAWTPFLVTPWLSLARRTYRHPECHSLPMSSCSDVKNIQIAGSELDCSQCSLRSWEGLVLSLQVCCVTVPNVGPPWEVGAQRETIFVCLSWPNDLFFPATWRGEHWAPSCVDEGSLLYISTEGHRPGLGSHTHSHHLTGHVGRCPQHGTQGREREQKESRYASGVTRRVWGSIMGPGQQEALVSIFNPSYPTFQPSILPRHSWGSNSLTARLKFSYIYSVHA